MTSRRFAIIGSVRHAVITVFAVVPRPSKRSSAKPRGPLPTVATRTASQSFATYQRSSPPTRYTGCTSPFFAFSMAAATLTVAQPSVAGR